MSDTQDGTLRLACPECGAKLGIPAAAAGKRIRCPKCQHRFVADPDAARVEPIAMAPEPPADDPFASENVGAFDDDSFGGELLDALAADAQGAAPISTAAPLSASPCPRCGAPMATGTRMCVQCGHDTQKKRKSGGRVKAGAGAKAASRAGIAVGCSLVGALLGAGLWAGITIATGYEIGWVAWAVGLLAGLGVTVATQERSQRMGLAAAGMALVGLLLGKAVIIEPLLEAEVAELVAQGVGDPLQMREVAMDELLETGKIGPEVGLWFALNEANAKPASSMAVKVTDARNRADQLVNTWSPAQKRAKREAYLRSFVEDVTFAEMFMASFGLLDIVFFILALGTAYKMGAGAIGES